MMRRTGKPILARYFHTKGSPVGNMTTVLYMLYVCSFFLHLAERIPGLGIIRPDLLLIILIGFMLLAQADKLKGRLRDSISAILLGLIAYIILTLPLVEWPGSILRENASIFIKAIVFYFFTVLIVDTDRKLKRFVTLIIFCQLFRVVEPLYMNLFQGYWGDVTHLGGGEFANRLSGAPHDIINPNGLAFVIATVYAFIHYLWWGGGWKGKLSYLVMCAPLFTALILTMSRSGFVAMMVIVWNIFIKTRRKILFPIIVAIAAILAWGVMDDVQRDRYFSLTGSEDTMAHASMQGRLDAMVKDFHVALNNPVFGYGLGTSMEAKGNTESGYQISHVLYAEILIELGILGSTIFLIFIFRIYNAIKIIGSHFVKIIVRDDANPLSYENRLLEVTKTCFWMYLIFSLAQYGLSEYHWYLLAGLVTVMSAYVSKHHDIRSLQGTSVKY